MNNNRLLYPLRQRHHQRGYYDYTIAHCFSTIIKGIKCSRIPNRQVALQVPRARFSRSRMPRE